MIHLTETGYNAGRRLCCTAHDDGARNVHAMHAPLDNDQFRAQCCLNCLLVWAMEAYDASDDMPAYIRKLRQQGAVA